MGWLSGAELWSIACASFVGPIWIRRFNWHTLARFGAFSALAGQIGSLFVTNFHSLLILRSVTGFFGEGVLMALSYAALGQTRNVERSFGLTYGISIVVGMVALLISPELDRLSGNISVLIILGVAAAAAFVGAGLIPGGPLNISNADFTSPRPKLAFSGLGKLGAVALLTQALWYAGTGGFWSFTEQIGTSNAIPSTDIARALGIGTAAALIGSFLALVLNSRFGQIKPIVVSIIAVMGVVLAFLASRHLILLRSKWPCSTYSGPVARSISPRPHALPTITGILRFPGGWNVSAKTLPLGGVRRPDR